MTEGREDMVRLAGEPMVVLTPLTGSCLARGEGLGLATDSDRRDLLPLFIPASSRLESRL